MDFIPVSILDMHESLGDALIRRNIDWYQFFCRCSIKSFEQFKADDFKPLAQSFDNSGTDTAARPRDNDNLFVHAHPRKDSIILSIASLCFFFKLILKTLN